ncbi:MAG: hypothetical protein AB7O50_14725 [Pseudolabrys sp.]
MCLACMQEDALFRAYLLERPDERDKLTDEEAKYYGFKRDPLTKKWIDAWEDAFAAEAVDSGPTPQ